MRFDRRKDYFDVIEDEKVPKEMLDLAIHIVNTKKGEFHPEAFQDQYEDALKELLRKKQKGEKIERAKEPPRTNVVNLMDALRKSVAEENRQPKRRRHERGLRIKVRCFCPYRVTEARTRQNTSVGVEQSKRKLGEIALQHKLG